MNTYEATTEISVKPTSLLGKAFWVFRRRPGTVIAEIRKVSLFLWARFWRQLFPLPGLELGDNVRLQRNRCAVAETPNARIQIGDDSIIYEFAKIEAHGRGHVVIGSQSVIGDARISSRYHISIGKRFLSSWNVFITDFDHHPSNPELRGRQVQSIVQNFWPRHDGHQTKNEYIHDEKNFTWDFSGESVVIGDDVWIGANASILKGAKIGDGCIIATGAVVLKGEYPPRSVLAGNPAIIVKSLEAHAHPRF